MVKSHLHTWDSTFTFTTLIITQGVRKVEVYYEEFFGMSYLTNLSCVEGIRDEVLEDIMVPTCNSITP